MSGLPFELLLALRYLRPKRTFVSVITLISVLGVTLGVAVLIIVISVMSGFDKQMRDTILGFNAHITVYQEDKAMKDYEAVMKIVRTNPSVKAVAPEVMGQVLVETAVKDGDSRQGAPYLRGIDPALETNVTTLATNIWRGEFNVKGHGLLIGRGLAYQLKVDVGDKLNVYSHNELKRMQKARTKEEQEAILPGEYEIRGIFDTGYWEYNSSFIIISLGNAQDMYNLGDDVHDLAVMLKDPLTADKVKPQLQEALGPDFEVKTWLEQSPILSAVAVEKNVMFIILFCIMIVAALCILSALITFVVQKTREIGMLKALGATDFQVGGLFLSQSAFIGTVGVILGLGLGFLALTYRNEFLFFMRRTTGMELFPASIYGFTELPALIVPGDILLICGSAFVICILGGVIPAWRAWRLTPVEALRYE